MIKKTIKTTLMLLCLSLPFAHANESNGLAPEVTDFNAKDASLNVEKQIPYLDKAYVSFSPIYLKDGLEVGSIDDEGVRASLLNLAKEIERGEHDLHDSLLIAQDGKLVFESYYRRGRIDFPHYQMSITKSYTALALGRAIQLGYLKMSDLDKPFYHFLEDLDPARFASGADKITLHDLLSMHSGIRLDKASINQVLKNPQQLKKQGQVQAYLEHTQAIGPKSQTYKYQGSDPSMVMQVLDAVVPGTAEEFIHRELLAKLGIEQYGWQQDVSGLPKAAAGSSVRSRDMVKLGLLMMNQGEWQGEQLISQEFINKATSAYHTNRGGNSYGYFWWRQQMQVNGKAVDCISARGAGGQFILIFPELNTVAVFTSHNKGMGKVLRQTVPKHLLPVLI